MPACPHLSLNIQTLKELDPSLYTTIEAERKRQEEHIELIAS